MTKYVRVDYEEHSALYVDGELVMWADSYLVDEYLFYDVLGGTTESSYGLYARFDTDSDNYPPGTLEEYRRWLTEDTE